MAGELTAINFSFPRRLLANDDDHAAMSSLSPPPHINPELLFGQHVQLSQNLTQHFKQSLHPPQRRGVLGQF